MPYIDGKSPQQMMNCTAPAIKSGEIQQSELGADEAIRLVIENPILIKRPLVAVDGKHIQGFNDERLQPYLGNWDGADDVMTCPNLKAMPCDEQSG